MNNLVECSFCGKFYANKNSIKTHIWRVHTEKDLNDNSNIDCETKNKKRVAWNKGLKRENSEILQKSANTLKENYSNGSVIKYRLGTKHTEETKLKISDARIKHIALNGISKKIGFGKFGWYKGYWCDSSYELAFVIYNLEHNINFERNSEYFNYYFNEKRLIYIPDFKIGDSHIEIKGRDSFEKLDLKTQEKIKQFPKNLIVLYNNDMKTYLNYVKGKYGKDFVSLYEGFIKPMVKIKILTDSQILKEKNKIESTNHKVNLILNSDIDFSVFGWVRKVSDLTGIIHQKVSTFMKKNMLDFYNNNCFKRK